MGYNPIVLFKSEISNPEPELGDIVRNSFDSYGIKGGDIVYFQKVSGSSAIKAAREFGEKGIKTVFGICDAIAPEMSEACDITIVPSRSFGNLYPEHLQEKIYYMHDGIESPDTLVTDYTKHPTKENPLEAVIVIAEKIRKIPIINKIPDWMRITVVGPYGGIFSLKSRIKSRLYDLATNPSNIVDNIESAVRYAKN